MGLKLVSRELELFPVVVDHGEVSVSPREAIPSARPGSDSLSSNDHCGCKPARWRFPESEPRQTSGSWRQTGSGPSPDGSSPANSANESRYPFIASVEPKRAQAAQEVEIARH